jgi:CDP-glucose 4,6-dehydratase
LLLVQALCESPHYARAWNFGPGDGDARTVEAVVRGISELLPSGVSWEVDEGPHPAETPYLQLDSSLAQEQLGWAPVMSLYAGLSATVDWFRGLEEGHDLRKLTLEQIKA